MTATLLENGRVLVVGGSDKSSTDTLARIHDLGNQFIRQSAGAAERDVVDELTDAVRRGISYYLISGPAARSPTASRPRSPMCAVDVHHHLHRRKHIGGLGAGGDRHRRG
jgi:hypothetical protein